MDGPSYDFSRLMALKAILTAQELADLLRGQYEREVEQCDNEPRATPEKLIVR